MSFKLTGIIKLIQKEQIISDKFRKKEFVITTEDKYPQDVLFTLTQNNTDLVDSIKVGEKVEVSFNLRGREWNGKYFNTLEAWSVAVQTSKAQPKATGIVANFQEDAINQLVEESDLPF